MPEQLPDINLLPEHERDTSFLFPLFIGLTVLMLVLYSFSAYQYFTASKKLSAAEEEHATLMEEEAELTAKISATEGDDITSVRDIAEFLGAQDVHTSIFIKEMNDLLPEERSYLANYQYTTNEATMTVHLETLDAVAYYTEAIKESDYTRDVKVDNISIFDPVDSSEENEILYFNEVLRYEANYTILLNKQAIKGEQEADE